MRFNLYAPELEEGSGLVVSIKGENDTDFQPIGSVLLSPASTNLSYEENLTRISFGTDGSNNSGFQFLGFETFQIDDLDSQILNDLRGKSATLKFELVGGGKVYLDDVFFKSPHLKFGLPTYNGQEPKRDSTYTDNHLLEKPQYVVSYDDESRTPRWVSRQLNLTWLGNLSRNGSWQSDSTLPSSFVKVDNPDYVGFNYDKGHMTASAERNRHFKDQDATFIFTNALPQNANNNTVLWQSLEKETYELALSGKELYIMSGGIGSLGTISSNNINVPRFIWKNILILPRPGLSVNDVIELGLDDDPDSDTPTIISVITLNEKVPNNFPAEGVPHPLNILFPGRYSNIMNDTAWQDWRTWQLDAAQGLNIRNLEEVTELKLLPSLDPILPSLPTAPLLAEFESATDSTRRNTTIKDASIWHTGIIENNILKTSRTQPLSVNTSQTGITQININHNSFIKMDSSKIGVAQVNIPKFNVPKISTSQITKSQINFNQSTPFSNLSSHHQSIFQNDIFHNNSNNIGTTQVCIGKVSTSKAKTPNFNTQQSSIAKISPVQYSSIAEASTRQICPMQVSISKIGTSKDSTRQTSNNSGISSSRQTSVISQGSYTQVDPLQVNSSKISLPTSIASEQFFSIHNSTPQLINNINNTALKLWNNLLKPKTSFDLNFQIKDLPTGQLAESTINSFDDSGNPNGGTIFIDSDANNKGWFIDPTPLDNSEFSNSREAEGQRGRGENYFLADSDSIASGKYDLLTTILHEIGHIAGFISGYAGFDQNIKKSIGKSHSSKVFVGDDFTATLSEDLSHLDSEAHPYDLMNTTLQTGVRKLPSELDVEILKAILSGKSEVRSQKLEGKQPIKAPLTSAPLIGIFNSDFDIADPTNPNYGWNTRGASTIEDSIAILTEDSPFNTNFTQTFTVPNGAKTLSFTLTDTQLGASPLSQTDSLLNIQNDGKTYFANNVKVGGAIASGQTLNLSQQRNVYVDISTLTPGSQATLYFDLLGFGERDSRVAIDNIKISAD